MKELTENEIPVSAILKGRSVNDIVSVWVDSFEIMKNSCIDILDEEERTAEAMALTIYRIYLLGVQDGMEG